MLTWKKTTPKPRCEYVWQQRQRHKCGLNPYGYNEKWLKINFRSKTVTDGRLQSETKCVYLIPQATAAPQEVHTVRLHRVYTPWQHPRGMQVVKDRDGCIWLSPILGCWSQWEYKGKNKFGKLWERVINTTKPDT